jgi:hypothetical protein
LPGFFVSSAQHGRQTASFARTTTSASPIETRSPSLHAMVRAAHGMAVAEGTDSGKWNGLRLMK